MSLQFFRQPDERNLDDRRRRLRHNHGRTEQLARSSHHGALVHVARRRSIAPRVILAARVVFPEVRARARIVGIPFRSPAKV
jgi:hypothetical protein